MTGPVGYRLDDQVAWITLDDGKVNALSPAMLGHIRAAFDRAEADGAVVVLRGREGVFSGGFDLAVLRGGGEDALAMLRGGFELSIRMLSFPRPVVVACTGHAIAMGFFSLLSADYRIGPAGSFRFVANEVAIGLPMPTPAMTVMRQRLTPAAYQRALCLAETFTPENAVEAGVLDRVVAPGAVVEAAGEVAASLARLDRHAHADSKRRAREAVLEEIRAGILSDFGAG